MLDAIRVAAVRLKYKKQLLQHGVTVARSTDIVEWAEDNYYIVDEETSEPALICLALHQKAVLRAAFTRLPNGRLPYSEVTYSTIKKSGKTCAAGIVNRWMAETQTRFGELFNIGNDFDQACDRSFKSVYDSIRLTPGARQLAGAWILPSKWICQKTKLECLLTGSVIQPLSVDARGEAGSNPSMTTFTELWGFEYLDALRFWEEMTPVPTKPDSMRLVETYAGYDGESNLLRQRYDTGIAGRQLTNRELALAAARDRSGEGYEDFLLAFAETEGDPEAKVPVWVNESAGMFTYWDSGLEARRMPWQQGTIGEKYYREREKNEPPAAFRRLHFNEWVGAESQYIPLPQWDSCQEQLPPFPFGDQTPIVLGVDAASTSDCFGVVAVSRHPDPQRAKTDVAVRAVRRWDPSETGPIDYDEAEQFIRQVCKHYNVVQIAYDPYQMVDMAQRLQRDSVAWCEPFPQMQDRLKADRMLYDLVINRRLAHDGNEYLREHIANANVKLQKDQDSTMRIVKKSSGRKIDLAVATSMAAYRCLYLLLD